MNEFLTPISIYFFFWLYNYSYILQRLNKVITNLETKAKCQEWKLLELVLYPLKCSFCFSWWVSIVLFYCKSNDFRLVCFNCLVCLFLDLTFKRLAGFKEVKNVV